MHLIASALKAPRVLQHRLNGLLAVVSWCALMKAFSCEADAVINRMLLLLGNSSTCNRIRVLSDCTVSLAKGFDADYRFCFSGNAPEVKLFAGVRSV